jgi:hypothetical protein
VPLSLQTIYGCLKVSGVAFTQAEHRSLTKIAQRVESERAICVWKCSRPLSITKESWAKEFARSDVRGRFDHHAATNLFFEYDGELGFRDHPCKR